MTVRKWTGDGIVIESVANSVKKPYLGIFEGINFPEYEYSHYPLMMSKEGDETDQVIVGDEDEETAAATDGYVSPKVGPPAVIKQADLDELNSENADLKAQLAAAQAQLAAKPGVETAAVQLAPKAVVAPAPVKP